MRALGPIVAALITALTISVGAPEPAVADGTEPGDDTGEPDDTGERFPVAYELAVPDGERPTLTVGRPE